MMPVYKQDLSALRNYLKRLDDIQNKMVSLEWWFNKQGWSSEFWGVGGDSGGFAGEYISAAEEFTYAEVGTTNTANSDYYLTVEGQRGIMPSPFNTGFTKVTLETRVKLLHITDIAAYIAIGPFISDYAEPTEDAAHFFVDTSIDNQWHARTYRSAEEQTNNLGAIDTEWHTLKIVWYRTKVEFYIDDVLVAIHTSQVPRRGLRPTYLVRTLADAVRALRIEYFKLYVE